MNKIYLNVVVVVYLYRQCYVIDLRKQRGWRRELIINIILCIMFKGFIVFWVLRWLSLFFGVRDKVSEFKVIKNLNLGMKLRK